MIVAILLGISGAICAYFARQYNNETLDKLAPKSTRNRPVSSSRSVSEVGMQFGERPNALPHVQPGSFSVAKQNTVTSMPNFAHATIKPAWLQPSTNLPPPYPEQMQPGPGRGDMEMTDMQRSSSAQANQNGNDA